METCGSCKFFLKYEGYESGACRRYPAAEPQNTGNWCGEYQPKPEPEPTA